MFSDRVQRGYLALLRNLAGHDPTIPGAPRISWLAAHKWVVDAKINGFGPGSLGALQFANNLTLLGVASPPSPVEMAQWISDHQDKGAFCGLQVLGFQLEQKNASPSAVRVAFLCVYAWLDNFLTTDDKLVLDFGPIFVEQLLCKVGRWCRRLNDYAAQKTAKVALSQLADKAFEGARWTSGENLTQFNKWPFPPCTKYKPAVFRKIIESR
ncbi:hypothetical protein FB45DRAFT_738642 [Roridomyces roridus]|uniref:Uncharacterized protein n=1 Tax=Roridomyces roridus TaxID=1738132 RepID=A0AAD7C7U5_9AGAR|nr:hypothetical protein FB45DRAFT_738642 [Roridomyces roridus]